MHHILMVRFVREKWQKKWGSGMTAPPFKQGHIFPEKGYFFTFS